MRKKIILAIALMMIGTSYVNIFSNITAAEKPAFSEITPADNAVNIDINTVQVSVLITDPDDQINWTIEGPYLTNTGANYTGDGTKTANLAIPLLYSTNIIWYVNATDGNESTQAEYNFFTRATYTPTAPSGFAATVYSSSRIDLTWTKGTSADRTYIERRTTATWNRGEGTLVYNDTGTNFSNTGLTESLRYYYQAWSWNETDRVFSTSYATTDATPENQRPTFSSVTPADAAGNIDVNTPTVNVMIQDPDGDPIDWTIQGQYLTNTGANDAPSGVKSANLILPLPYTTTIIWYVNATDGNEWTNESYSFTTRNRYTPSTPSEFTATVYSKSRINLTWTKGDKADRTYIERNTSSSWNRGEGTLVYNETGISFQDSGLTENQIYYYRWWSWNETDHLFSVGSVVDNEIPTNQRPMFLAVTPADNTGNVDIYIAAVGVFIQDPDGDLFNWTIEGAYLTSAGTNGASNGTKTASFFATLPYTTNIRWYVNATDGYGTKSIPYNFTTRPNLPPAFSSVTPANNSINIGINTATVSVYIQDPDSERFDWTIEGKYVTNTGDTNVSQGTKSAPLITPLPKDTIITWYVNATDTGSGSRTSMTYYFSTITTSLPTSKYSINPGIGLSAVGPIVADVNNDGRMEILRSGPDGIVCLTWNGATFEELWRNNSKMWNDHCPMEAIDLNKDGILEIITSYDTGTRALHGNNGSLYWYNKDAPLHNKYCVAGDIDGDGYPEVYVCTIGSVTALTHDGHIFNKTWTYYPCFGGLTLGDTDYDGVFELYQGDRSNYYPEYPSGGRGIIAYWASNLTLRWYDEEVLCSSQCPTLADIDKDGKLDIIICNQRGAEFRVYNTNGDIIRKASGIPGLKSHSQATIYDIDNDGNLEIISCRDWSKPIIWDLYENKLDAMLPYECYEPPAIADINGDGFVEIICCTEKNISIFNHDYQFMGNITLSNPSNYGMSMIVAQDVDGDGLLELVFNRVQTVYVYETSGAVPNPLALSQFNFYSQHRGRAPYYVEYKPEAPVILEETPTNGSIDIVYNPPLSVRVFDCQYNLMTITFRTNISGSWSTIRTFSDAPGGTYTVTPTGMSQPSRNYWWRVNASDSTGHTTTKTYHFRTVDTMIISGVTPTDLAPNVAPNPQLSVHVEQRAGHNMTISFRTNASGSWATLGTYVNVTNGTYSQPTTTFSTYNKKYYWGVNCYDGQYWLNDTFSFTTRSSGGGGGGEVPPEEPDNQKPIADASAGEPYQGVVNQPVTFDGSRSYDPDGNVTSWSWTFGDGSTGSGKTVTHTYTANGTYQVSLTVTDDQGATDTDTTMCTITQQNRTPTAPVITGPTSGTKNTLYLYTAVATDADNDTLQYIFTWDGSDTQSSGFLPNNTNFSVSRSWTAAGRYTLEVMVTDKTFTSSSTLTVYIDAVSTGDLGYLLDNNADGIYDAFYSEETQQTMAIQRKDGSYLIDSNGDGTWDYLYDAAQGMQPYEEPSIPGFELLFALCAIAVAIVLWRKRRTV